MRIAIVSSSHLLKGPWTRLNGFAVIGEGRDQAFEKLRQAQKRLRDAQLAVAGAEEAVYRTQVRDGILEATGAVQILVGREPYQDEGSGI